AIIQFAIDSQNNSPQASVQSFTGQQGMQVVEQNQISVNGMSGYQEVAVAQMEDGTQLQLQFSAISYAGNIYNFLAYTLLNMYGQYQPVFNAVIGGFNSVSDPNILNAQPARLNIQQVDRSAAFQQLIPQNLPVNIGAMDLAIIN